jgi:hypothetical protein
MAKKSGIVKKQNRLNNREIQLALIENFVNLQKVLTNLTVKFDNLSDNISRLLQLFEISAKSFVEKNENYNGEDKDTLRKLDTLLDQNKTIAKGLTLIEEKIKHKIYPDLPKETFNEENSEKPRPRPLPRI